MTSTLLIADEPNFSFCVCFFVFSHLVLRIVSCPSQSVNALKRRLGCWKVCSIPTLSASMIPGKDLAKERSALFWSLNSWRPERLKRKCRSIKFEKRVQNLRQIFIISRLGKQAAKKKVEFPATGKQEQPHFHAILCEPPRCQAQSQLHTLKHLITIFSILT